MVNNWRFLRDFGLPLRRRWLLSNRSSDRRRAKYRFLHIVRTYHGTNARSFRCIYQEQDDQGKVGVSLSKDLMAISGGALKTNITTLWPLVLPVSEELIFFATFAAKKLFNAKVNPYIPDFKLAFEHFCIHTGTRREEGGDRRAGVEPATAAEPRGGVKDDPILVRQYLVELDMV